VRLCAAPGACAAALDRDTRAPRPVPTPLPRAGGVMLPSVDPPIGRFLGIVLLFAAAVGPGGLWVTRRRGAAWALVVIPALSVAACLLMAGYATFREGFGVKAATRAVTFLDSKNAREVQLVASAFYANLAPGDLSPPSGGVPVPVGAGRKEELTDTTFDWTGSGRVGGAALPSRSYREWGLVTVQPSRARLLVRREGAGVRVRNALGGRLLEGKLRFDGETYRLAEVEDGGEAWAELADKGWSPAPPSRELSARFSGLPVLDAAGEGSFLARVDSGPLAFEGLRAEVVSAERIVLGQVEAP
jgi:hypothetical protein